MVRRVGNGAPTSFRLIAMTGSNRTEHIRLTSHPDPGGKARFPIEWGAATAQERGPVIATFRARAIAMSSAVMAAPTRSIVRSPCRPGRSILFDGRI